MLQIQFSVLLRKNVNFVIVQDETTVIQIQKLKAKKLYDKINNNYEEPHVQRNYRDTGHIPTVLFFGILMQYHNDKFKRKLLYLQK